MADTDVAMQVTNNGPARMTVLGGGNVGIGTTSPANTLAVTGSQNNEYIVTFVNSYSGTNSYGVAITTTGSTSDTVGALEVNSNGSRVFTVANSGRVGIGTNSPLANADLTLEGGALALKERATPTADANYGKVYTKTDNKLYFQDGAGTEHELAFA